MEVMDYVVNISDDEEPILAVVEKYMTNPGGISHAEFQKAKRLLNSFKHVLWTINSNVKALDEECRATMNEDLAYAVEILDKFDYRMDTDKLERKLVANQETRLMANLIVAAIFKVKEYPTLGENYYNVLQKTYLSKDKSKETDKDFERISENEERSAEIIPADPYVRNFTYTFFDGKLYFRENSEMIRQEISQNTEERIRLLHEIRQVTRELIDIQMEGCSEEELTGKQKELNDKYDKFIEQYGVITSKANKTAFRDDSDYPLLCSLEEVNEDGEVKKADMFYKQTIKAKTMIERVETAVEALNVSVNEYGTVNIPYMLSIYELDISTMREKVAEENGERPEEVSLSKELEIDLKRALLVEELEGLIYLNPESYNENNPNAGWETADEYLSGNVGGALAS